MLRGSNEFTDYFIALDNFSDRRQKGIPASDLEDARLQLATEFTRCFNRVSQWNRPVIALDTAERIQYEADDIQEECGIQDVSTTVRSWLVEQLRQWRNCVVLLVGRPEANNYLGAAFERGLASLPDMHYCSFNLGGFDFDEMSEFFRFQQERIPEVREIDSAFLAQIWAATDGNPIRLNLAIHIMQYSLEWEEFQRKIVDSSTANVRGNDR